MKYARKNLDDTKKIINANYDLNTLQNQISNKYDNVKKHVQFLETISTESLQNFNTINNNLNYNPDNCILNK
jgi:hypothetical protein